MNEKLYSLLNEKTEEMSNYYNHENEERAKELVFETRKELERIFVQNSFLLDEPMDMQSALVKFFYHFKIDLEKYIAHLEDKKTDIEEDIDEDVYQSLLEDINIEINQFQLAHEFAIEIENL